MTNEEAARLLEKAGAWRDVVGDADMAEAARMGATALRTTGGLGDKDAEIQRLREALKPFAALADAHPTPVAAGHPLWVSRADCHYAKEVFP